MRTDALISFRECHFDEHVLLRDAHVGPVSFAGSTIRGVLDARGSLIEGFLFLRFGFSCLRGVLLREVRVKSTLNCEGASFGVSDDEDLDFYWRSQVRGEAFAFERGSAETLIWRKMMTRPTGIINLRNSRVQEFRDTMLSPDDVLRDWPEPGLLQLRGFDYSNRPRGNADVLVRWLELQSAGGAPLHIGAYDVALKVLTRDGEIHAANEIGRAREYRLLRQERRPAMRVVRAIFYYGSHGGHGIQRAAIVMVTALLLSWLSVDLVFSAGGIMPKSPEVRKDACFSYRARCSAGWPSYVKRFRTPPTYPEFDSLGYAADAFFPGLTFGFEDDWQPVPDWAIWVVDIVRLSGLLTISMLALVLTGVVRR
jgi:hypothetical protein